MSSLAARTGSGNKVHQPEFVKFETAELNEPLLMDVLSLPYGRSIDPEDGGDPVDDRWCRDEMLPEFSHRQPKPALVVPHLKLVQEFRSWPTTEGDNRH
jgi:hypothetical protein